MKLKLFWLVLVSAAYFLTHTYYRQIIVQISVIHLQHLMTSTMVTFVWRLMGSCKSNSVCDQQVMLLVSVTMYPWSPVGPSVNSSIFLLATNYNHNTYFTFEDSLCFWISEYINNLASFSFTSINCKNCT